MANIFAITAAINSAKINSKRQAEVAFTVSNAENRPMRGRAHILPEGEAALDWFSLVGDPEQTFAVAGTQQYTVKIEVPPDAPAGDYFFRLNMVGVENPDEDFAEGPSVSFTVPEPEEKKKPFPWWILLVILAVIILGGVAAFLLTRGEPELMVTAEVSANPVIAGRDMTYTIQVSNTGGKKAENVIVKDTLPIGVTFISADNESCALGEAGEIVSCTLANGLGGNATAEITLNVSVDGSARGTMTNTVLLDTTDLTITPEPTTETEPKETAEAPSLPIQVVTISTAVGQTVLTAGLAGPDAASADEEIVYLVTVGNTGDSSATDVILTFPLPEGILGATGISQKGNCDETMDSVRCELGQIETGETLSVTLTVLPGPEVVGALSGIVMVTDSDGANVSSQTVTTQVEPATGLAVLVNTSGSQALIGVPFKYTVRIWNSSPLAANDVVMSYVIPEGWDFISTEPECPQQIFAGETTVICDFGDLPPNPDDVRSVAITLQARIEGKITNNFEVSSSLPPEQIVIDTNVAKAFSAVGLRFDGKNDWAEMDDFNVPETFTIEMWVNPESSRDGQAIIGKHLANGDNVLILGYYNNGLNLTLHDQSYSAGVKTTGLYHLAVVVEKRTLSQSVVTIYQNGEVFWDQEYAAVMGEDISGRGWVLGQEWDADTKTDFYNGAVTELRFWDHARTPEQINALMDGRMNGDEAGLIAYLPLTEPSGNTGADQTGNGHNATLQNGALWVDAAVPDNFGTALNYDGSNDYVTIPDSTSLDLSTFSIGVWVKPTQIIINDWQPIITKEDILGLNRNFGLFIIPNDLRVHFSFNIYNCITWHVVNTNNQMVLNEWNHIMATYDGTESKIYLNGVLENTASLAGTVCQNNEPVKIGLELAEFLPFAGSIDEVRIYNRALTLAEIQANMNQILKGNEAGLVGYWRFDEGSGSMAYDLSGNGNDGQLVGGPGWVNSEAGNE